MGKPITAEELAAWRAAREQATGGEWHSRMEYEGDPDDDSPALYIVDEMLTEEDSGGCSWMNEHNAAFIALAANQWGRLLDEVEDSDAEIDRLFVALITSAEECIEKDTEIRRLTRLARELADELPSATSAEARRLLERSDVLALREEE